MDWQALPDDGMSRWSRKREAFLREPLTASLEILRTGVSIFDHSQRLIGCNQNFRDHLRLPRSTSRAGAALFELLRYHAQSKTFIERVGRSDDLFAMWLVTHSAKLRTSVPFDELQWLRDGRVLMATYSPTPDGGWIAIHRDVSFVRPHVDPGTRDASMVDLSLGCVKPIRARPDELARTIHSVRRDEVMGGDEAVDLA